LFPVRAAPHEVYGALDVQLAHAWFDLPHDLALAVDRYETSDESTWRKEEVDQRWQLAVRDKLVRGEVGWRKLQLYQQQQTRLPQSLSAAAVADELSISPLPWKLTLRGGILQLMHGQPKCLAGQEDLYPITALLTVLSPNTISTNTPAIEVFISSSLPTTATTTDTAAKNSTKTATTTEKIIPSALLAPGWTLLSLDVRVQAKTGEFNHQLETSNRQRYDLHRLAALAMAREEARVRRQYTEAAMAAAEPTKQAGTSSMTTTKVNENGSNKSAGGLDTIPPAQPLQALFQAAQTFSLSWQLELLSAQAQALRRGVWAAGESNPIQVTPVRFVDGNLTGSGRGNKGSQSTMLGVVSISFWKVDDSYGRPTMGDLTLDSQESQFDCSTLAQQQQQQPLGSASRTHHAATTNQLTLSIRAEPQVGMRVSMSGAMSVMEALKEQPHLRDITRDLLEAASNPLALSASDALLAATRLCAELKCLAVVEALQPSSGQPSILPNWILLSVERGRIDVAALVHYHGIEPLSRPSTGGMPILFRLTCDARTGSFVNTFPRETKLLRQLACNNHDASESMTLRIASLPPNRRRAAGVNSSGRLVRDAFEGLIRSMNLLGQRAGVGGSWDNLDGQSARLRERAIQAACSDVKVSLLKCCGMAAVFGLTPLAIGSAVGLEACSDM